MPPRDPPEPQPNLPLAARDALVGLLLVDLADAAGRCVSAALDALALEPGERLARHPNARICDALVEAGLLQHDASADAGSPAFVRVAAPWVELAAARLHAYAAALSGIARGADLDARLAQARRLFAERLFFEVHEVLEPPWQRASGDERRTLQGLIQAAVAWHHWWNGNASGAARLAEAARVKLEGAADGWRGFPVAAVRRSVGAWHMWLAGGARGAAPPLPFADEAGRDAGS